MQRARGLELGEGSQEGCNTVWANSSVAKSLSAREEECLFIGNSPPYHLLSSCFATPFAPGSAPSPP
jgi:hypothetical protein